MVQSAGRIARAGVLLVCAALMVAGCGRITSVLGTDDGPGESAAERNVREDLESTSAQNSRQSTLFDLFTNVDDPNTTIEVNKYLWNAALEARSLNVALATRSGPAPTATVRAVEDAILTRARELRLRDLDL